MTESDIKSIKVENCWIDNDAPIGIVFQESSKWTCYLFGNDGSYGHAWRPLKGKEPNWFWRWMQFLCFGNRWVKDK